MYRQNHCKKYFGIIYAMFVRASVTSRCSRCGVSACACCPSHTGSIPIGARFCFLLYLLTIFCELGKKTWYFLNLKRNLDIFGQLGWKSWYISLHGTTKLDCFWVNLNLIFAAELGKILIKRCKKSWIPPLPLTPFNYGRRRHFLTIQKSSTCVRSSYV